MIGYLDKKNVFFKSHISGEGNEDTSVIMLIIKTNKQTKQKESYSALGLSLPFITADLSKSLDVSSLV